MKGQHLSRQPCPQEEPADPAHLFCSSPSLGLPPLLHPGPSTLAGVARVAKICTGGSVSGPVAGWRLGWGVLFLSPGCFCPLSYSPEGAAPALASASRTKLSLWACASSVACLYPAPRKEAGDFPRPVLSLDPSVAAASPTTSGKAEMSVPHAQELSGISQARFSPV